VSTGSASTHSRPARVGGPVVDEPCSAASLGGGSSGWPQHWQQQHVCWQ
jgi:hypothetical protein